MLGITPAKGIALTQIVVLLAAPLPRESAPPAPPPVVPRRPSGLVNPTDAYLVLSVEPAKVVAGALITLNIEYRNIGLPYTFVFSSPTGLVVFDPPITLPCRFSEHPNGCRALTFRTTAPGIVLFHATAQGEVFDEKCGCWYFTFVSDNGAAALEIGEPASRLYLPAVHR